MRLWIRCEEIGTGRVLNYQLPLKLSSEVRSVLGSFRLAMSAYLQRSFYAVGRVHEHPFGLHTNRPQRLPCDWIKVVLTWD